MSGRGSRGGRGRSKGSHPPKLDEGPNDKYFEPNYFTKVNNFDEMKLDPALIDGIDSYGFKVPSEIQSLAIVPIHEGRHVLAQGQSDTGKTGAFGIGILNRINLNLPITQALILTPTRENSFEIFEFLKSISSKMEGIKIACIIGGSPMNDSIKEAEAHHHIIVATPGRALDLIQHSHINCDGLTMLCMDETNVLLGEGFLEQITHIFQYIPQNIQFILFSIEFPPYIYNLLLQFVKNPIKILVKTETSIKNIEQYFVDGVETNQKIGALIDIISRLHISKAIIYANSREAVEYISQNLQSQSLLAVGIHEGIALDQRKKIMKEFRRGETQILIGTDQINHSIKFEQVPLIINIEMPEDGEKYLYRIGTYNSYHYKKMVINIIDKKERQKLDDIKRIYSCDINYLPEDFSQIYDNLLIEEELSE